MKKSDKRYWVIFLLIMYLVPAFILWDAVWFTNTPDWHPIVRWLVLAAFTAAFAVAEAFRPDITRYWRK